MAETLRDGEPNEELLSRLFGTIDEIEHESEIRAAKSRAEDADGEAVYSCHDTNIVITEEGSRYL
jgi:hypothetical protein